MNTIIKFLMYIYNYFQAVFFRYFLQNTFNK